MRPRKHTRIWKRWCRGACTYCTTAFKDLAQTSTYCGPLVQLLATWCDVRNHLGMLVLKDDAAGADNGAGAHTSGLREVSSTPDN